MKCEITYYCGHTGTVQIYGSAKEREAKASWYATKVCPDCYKAQNDANAAKGCDEVAMAYRDYKDKYAGCKTKSGSYDSVSKTIIVYVPRAEPDKSAAVSDEEITAELITAGATQTMAVGALKLGSKALENNINIVVSNLSRMSDADRKHTESDVAIALNLIDILKKHGK